MRFRTLVFCAFLIIAAFVLTVFARQAANWLGDRSGWEIGFLGGFVPALLIGFSYGYQFKRELSPPTCFTCWDANHCEIGRAERDLS